ncbi:MAG: hypothetical protein IPM25_06325 [Chloracidobacterium sp.]|nr:hypothetical protein [Chloracidobacterium sp.]
MKFGIARDLYKREFEEIQDEGGRLEALPAAAEGFPAEPVAATLSELVTAKQLGMIRRWAASRASTSRQNAAWSFAAARPSYRGVRLRHSSIISKRHRKRPRSFRFVEPAKVPAKALRQRVLSCDLRPALSPVFQTVPSSLATQNPTPASGLIFAIQACR